MTSTVDNKRIVTRDLYLRGETGANPGGDTVPRFSADGKMQFSTVTVDSGGSLGVPGSALIQGNLTVNGLINGGAGGGGVSVAAGPSGNVTVATAAGVATVDLAPLLTGVDISGDIDVTGELEAKSLRILTGAIVDGAFSAGSANVLGAAHVEGALTGGSTVTATGKIRSTGGDIEAINGILSGTLAVDGAATVGSLTANQTVTVAGKLAANAADISRNVAVGGNVDVSGVVTAAGLVLRNAFVVDTLQVRGATTISGDLFVNSTVHHVGLFDPPIGEALTLLGGNGIDVTEGPGANTWTIEYTGGGGSGGGISGINEGSNIQVLTSGGINPIVSIRIDETLDMCNNKITNVDIIELVSTATDTEDPRVSFKDVNGVQRAQVEYNQDNQAEPLLLVEGPRVLIEATEADNVSGVTLATAGNTLTVTDASVDLAVPLLTMGGVAVSVDASKNFVIDNTNAGGGYKIKSIPDVATATGFDDMLVYNVATGEIRQTTAPMGTDICGGTNIVVDKSTPEKPVVSLEVREDIDMGGKGLVFASGVGFSSGGSIVEGGAGSLCVTTKVGVNTAAGATPTQELEVSGGIQASTLYLTGVADAVMPNAKVLGYNSGTNEIELQDAVSGGGASMVLTAGTNIDIVGGAINVAIDEAVDMGGQDITNAGNITISSSGSLFIESGIVGIVTDPVKGGGIEFEDQTQNVIGEIAVLSNGKININGDNIELATGATPNARLNITATGNVGIGTVNPQKALDVNGSIAANNTISVNLDAVAGGNGLYALNKNNGTVQWAIGLDGVPTGSGNVGNNFSIYSYADNGGFLSSPLSISRATGAVSVGVLNATGAVSGASISTGGTVTASGNISGGSISTTGDVTATGVVSGGSISTTGGVTASGNISTSGEISALRTVTTSLSLNTSASAPSNANDMYYDGTNLYFRGMIVNMINPASYIPGVSIEYFRHPDGDSAITTVPYTPFVRSTYGIFSSSRSMSVSAPVTESLQVADELGPRALCVLSGWFKPTTTGNYTFSTIFKGQSGIPMPFSFYINGSKYTVGNSISLTAGVYYKIDVFYEIQFTQYVSATISIPPAFSWSPATGAMFINNTACC